MPGVLVFFYDEFMLESRNKVFGEGEFLSYAYVNAKQYWIWHRRHRRIYYILPYKSTVYGKVFGTIFYYPSLKYNGNKIYSYYSSGVGSNTTDTHVLVKMKATPILFSSIKEIDESSYEEGKPVECMVAIGNLNHKQIKAYKENKKPTLGVIPSLFLKSLEEQNNKLKGIEKNELEHNG